jgi:hypothetical protein
MVCCDGGREPSTANRCKSIGFRLLFVAALPEADGVRATKIAKVGVRRGSPDRLRCNVAALVSWCWCAVRARASSGRLAGIETSAAALGLGRMHSRRR